MTADQPHDPAYDSGRAHYVRCMHELAAKFKDVVDALARADEAAREYRQGHSDDAPADLLVALFDVGRAALRDTLMRAGDALVGAVPLVSTDLTKRTEA